MAYRLRIALSQMETARRVHGFHACSCPVARTIRNCVVITTKLELIPEEP
ncbi:hypothetical protein [Thermoflexus hugenholtzii]